MAAELASEYDPVQADYAFFLGFPYTPDQAQNAQITGGLVGLAAMALIGIGAFFTGGAILAGTATTVTYTVADGTVLVYSSGTALTAGQAAIAAVIESGALATEPVAVNAILSSWGMKMFTMESLLALASFNVTSPPQYSWTYGNFGHFMGNWSGLGQGAFSTPPGFPEFPGHGGPVGGPSAGWVCTEWDDGTVCEWTLF